MTHAIEWDKVTPDDVVHALKEYDRLGPMRRDFSIVLEEHGLDLERALHDVDVQPDYSVADHARDLAGALRWNAAGVLRRRSGHPGGRHRSADNNEYSSSVKD